MPEIYRICVKCEERIYGEHEFAFKEYLCDSCWTVEWSAAFDETWGGSEMRHHENPSRQEWAKMWAVAAMKGMTV